MQIIEIVVVVACALIVLGVIAHRIVKKKKGKSSECCGCQHSSQCTKKK